MTVNQNFLQYYNSSNTGQIYTYMYTYMCGVDGTQQVDVVGKNMNPGHY